MEPISRNQQRLSSPASVAVYAWSAKGALITLYKDGKLRCACGGGITTPACEHLLAVADNDYVNAIFDHIEELDPAPDVRKLMVRLRPGCFEGLGRVSRASRICNFCGAVFGQVSDLEYHLTICSVLITQRPENKRWACSWCGTIYTNEEWLVSHLKECRVAKIPKNVCSFCGFVGANEQALLIHLNSCVDRINAETETTQSKPITVIQLRPKRRIIL